MNVHTIFILLLNENIPTKKSGQTSQFTRIKYEVHGGSLHCFKYCVNTDETFGRILFTSDLNSTYFTKSKMTVLLDYLTVSTFDFDIMHLDVWFFFFFAKTQNKQIFPYNSNSKIAKRD